MRITEIDVRIKVLVNDQANGVILLETTPEIAIPGFGKNRILMVIKPVSNQGYKFLDETLLFYQLVKALSEHQGQEFIGTISGAISILGAKRTLFQHQPENTKSTWPSLVIENGSLTIDGIRQTNPIESL